MSTEARSAFMNSREAKRKMYEAGAATIVLGGLALLDAVVEGGLAAVPVIGWIGDLVNVIPEVTFVSLALFAADKFFHYRNEYKKSTGKVSPDSKPAQMSQLLRRTH